MKRLFSAAETEDDRPCEGQGWKEPIAHSGRHREYLPCRHVWNLRGNWARERSDGIKRGNAASERNEKKEEAKRSRKAGERKNRNVEDPGMHGRLKVSFVTSAPLDEFILNRGFCYGRHIVRLFFGRHLLPGAGDPGFRRWRAFCLPRRFRSACRLG